MVMRSDTGVIRGRGSDPWKWVAGLTASERRAVKRGGLVYLVDPEAGHYTQSGYKVVLYRSGKYYHREPTPEQLRAILQAEGVRP